MSLPSAFASTLRTAAKQPLTPRRAIRDGTIIAGIVWIIAQAGGLVGPFTDARAYWESGQIPWYSTIVGETNAFTYSPAFGQTVAPFTLLPWPIFAGLWAVLLFGTLTWMCGRWLPIVIILPPVAFELYAGNIHILLAAAIMLGWRHPWAWSFVLLTKVTPGVGLLWFTLRREWRSLAIALGSTGAIILISFVLAPNAWFGWVDYLANTSPPTQATVIPIPLAPRLVAATLVVSWGSLTNRPWTVPVAAMLALPVLWIGSLAMLLALIARPGSRFGVERRTRARSENHVGPEMAGAARRLADVESEVALDRVVAARVH